MDIFNEMNKYKTGQSPEGDDLFSIPLKPDNDGLTGRECPNDNCEPKYFKISNNIPEQMSKEMEDFSQINVTCPYCGTIENMQEYYTKSQIEWIESMIMRDAIKSIQDMLSNSFKPTHSSNDMFSVSFSYKPGSLPSVRHYVEDKLKQKVICDNCNYNYAVYGISFHCPLCGEGNLLQHLNRSANIIKVLIEESERIGQEKGEEIGQKMIGNALEDVVTLFETFLKHIYQYHVKHKFSGEELENKIKNIRNNFQRLEGAENLYSKDLNFALLDKCNKEDKNFLHEQFLKRHVLTHNLGLVDKKYIEKAQIYEKQGVELDIKSNEVLRALDIVVNIVSATAKSLKRQT